MTAEKPAAKKPRFEDHLRQVEEAVKALESGKLGLEESIEKFQQGKSALDECYRILEEAERKIQILVKEKDGSLSTRDYEGAASESRPARRKTEAT